MPSTPENHPQLPGLETPNQEFDSEEVSRRIADSSLRHRDAIARRYDETASRFDGVLPESDDEEKSDTDVIQGAGSSVVAEVVSIDHIDEEPTEEELKGARGRHPTSGLTPSVPEMIRRTREHLQSLPSHEERVAQERREKLLEFARRPNKDPKRLEGLPRPPLPPNNTEK